jgi:hypothetical protein
MGRHPPAAEAESRGGTGGGGGRCPRCGSGELFLIELARPGAVAGRAAYCAGVYDRERRRFVRRSCGYSGAAPEGGESALRTTAGPSLAGAVSSL